MIPAILPMPASSGELKPEPPPLPPPVDADPGLVDVGDSLSELGDEVCGGNEPLLGEGVSSPSHGKTCAIFKGRT